MSLLSSIFGGGGGDSTSSTSTTATDASQTGGAGSIIANNGSTIYSADALTAQKALDTAVALNGATLNSADLLINTVGQIATDNNNLTETTRAGNAALAGSIVDSATTLAANAKADTNAQLLQTLAQYAAYGIVALVALFLLFGRKSTPAPRPRAAGRSLAFTP